VFPSPKVTIGSLVAYDWELVFPGASMGPSGGRERRRSWAWNTIEEACETRVAIGSECSHTGQTPPAGTTIIALQLVVLAGDRNTIFRRGLDALDSLRGCRFAKGDEWEVVRAEGKERAGLGDKTDKGGLVIRVITLAWEDIPKIEAWLEEHKR
jgi:hypothetical protein